MKQLALVLVLIATASCGHHPAPEVTITDADVTGIPLNDRVGLRQRCTEKQAALLEKCEQSGDPDACAARARTFAESCAEFPEEELSVCSGEGEGEGTGLCDGTCLTKACTVAAPCNLGKDVDGDGINDSCITGQRCDPTIEGTVCDAGIFFDCYCTTFYYPKNAIRPLDECRCYCD